jgi:hypothetical protein
MSASVKIDNRKSFKNIIKSVYLKKMSSGVVAAYFKHKLCTHKHHVCSSEPKKAYKTDCNQSG